MAASREGTYSVKETGVPERVAGVCRVTLGRSRSALRNRSLGRWGCPGASSVLMVPGRGQRMKGRPATWRARQEAVWTYVQYLQSAFVHARGRGPAVGGGEVAHPSASRRFTVLLVLACLPTLATYLSTYLPRYLPLPDAAARGTPPDPWSRVGLT